MADSRSEQIRVLYAASEERTRERVRDCLEDAEDRIDVVTVPDIETATERVRTERVDCVVSDHDLPDGTGLDLLETVREHRPTRPFVLYPDGGSEQLASEATALGVTRYQPREQLADTCEKLASAIVAGIEEQTEKQAALDRMTDAFFAVDGDWRFTYLNERGQEIIREAMPAEKRDAVEDLHGVDLWDAVPAAVGTTFYDRYHEAMETQEPITFEEYYEPLETWFEVRTYPSQSGLSVYFRDVTDRKEYEGKLEHRESVLTSMYRTVADKDRSFEEKIDQFFAIGREELGVEYGTLSRVDGDDYVFEYVQTPEGDDTLENGDVVPLSWTSCERAVTSRERLVVSDMDAAPPDVADRTGNEELGLKCYLGTPVIVDGDVYGTFCFYGSEPREGGFSQWQIALVDLMGSWVSYEFERQQREEELTRERNRLEEFASVVSHDLRNPLNVAVSNLELARDDDDSDELATVADALDHMETLIEDVLALARLGQQVGDEEPLDFTDLVRTAWATVGDPSSRLVLEGEASTIVGDETRLRQLFENLFRNAIEHGAGGESETGVTVRVGPLDDDQGFYVADDGPGIPEEERESVFERGFTTADDGTGFGLSIVEGIVEAHDGAITVAESEHGGARFEITGIDVR